MTKEIPLTQGKVALVDDEDYESLVQFKWFANKIRNSWYAIRGSGGKDILMHRLIISPPSGILVDHINRDGLDNRRSNLRLATGYENQHNRGKQSNNTSGYKGVHWYKQTSRWQAQIMANGRRIHIGFFPSAEEAARAYDARAHELHGEFARTNFG